MELIPCDLDPPRLDAGAMPALALAAGAKAKRCGHLGLKMEELQPVHFDKEHDGCRFTLVALNRWIRILVPN